MKIIVDPSYPSDRSNALFHDGPHNRDRSLDSMLNLKKHYGAALGTVSADGSVNEDDFLYISLGALASNWQEFSNLKSYCLLEAPLIAPSAYRNLSEILVRFENVYLYGGYNALNYRTRFGINASVHKVFYPIPWTKMEAECSYGERKNGAAAIASNRSPKLHRNQLYSERIRAVVASSESFKVDLFGRDWDKIFRLHSVVHPSFLVNRGKLRTRYRGAIESKLSVLSTYRFGLVLENAIHPGYVTEKIFDCMAAGAVPIYLGAPDINDFVNPKCFIDVRRFSSWGDVFKFSAAMSEKVWSEYQANICEAMCGPRTRRHVDFLSAMVSRAVGA